MEINNLYPYPNGTYADQRLTVSSSAVAFADTFDSNTRYVVIDIQNYDVMVTFDGSTPTSSNGHHLVAGEKYTWHILTARTAKFIRQGANDAVVHGSQFTL